jgi:hypothetical protein
MEPKKSVVMKNILKGVYKTRIYKTNAFSQNTFVLKNVELRSPLRDWEYKHIAY